MNIENRYRELVKEITDLDYHYYTLDNPKVTDKEYDDLYNELLEIEKDNPSIVVQDSPSARVGGPVLEGFEKKEHTVPLLSLDKANFFEEVYDFVAKRQKGISLPLSFSLEQKMDGLAIVLKYVNRKFVEARTRGTGDIGEVITDQVRTIRSIPITIPFDGVVEVQGEIFMDKKRLEVYNASLLEQFQVAKEELEQDGIVVEGKVLERLREKYKALNARNGAAGAVRNHDPKVTSKRPIDAFFYGVPYIEGRDFNTQEEVMEFLKEQTFKTNPYFYVCKNADEIVEKLEEMTSIRPNLNYEIDGMVIKVNEMGVRDEIGWTSKHPKWAVAFKFEAAEKVTVALGEEWYVGRTGKQTPVFEVEPVEFDGVVVRKVTGNNMGDIIRKGILVGGEVVIRRSNDVIPEILHAVPGTEGRQVVAPEVCGSCGSPVIEDGAHLYCSNQIDCPAQTMGRFIHFASREAMNIDTLSKKTIEQLYEAGLIVRLQDLYNLQEEDLLKLDRFGKRKAEKLLAAIEKSKETPFQAFIYALGLRKVGKGTAERLLRYYDNIDEIQSATKEELMNIEDIGEFVAQSLVSYFHSEAAREEIEEFRKIGIKLEQEKKEVTSNAFEGLTFVITGSFEGRNRNDIKTFIIDNGGKATGSVSKNTDYLVAGEKAGSKMKKAEDLGVSVISLEQLESTNI